MDILLKLQHNHLKEKIICIWLSSSTKESFAFELNNFFFRFQQNRQIHQLQQNHTELF